MFHQKILIEGKEKKAFLTTYILDNYDEFSKNRIRPIVVICPGGGYAMTSDREAEAVAIRMNNFGYHAAVLKYSVAPSRYPESLIQLAKSLKLLRESAVEWNIDSQKIIIAGFSAGGHLAASLGVSWHNEAIYRPYGLSSHQIQPNGLLLSYPVISSKTYGHKDSFLNLLGENYEAEHHLHSLEDLVTGHTPKSFIWHTDEDDLVVAENSLNFVLNLRKAKVPVEFHLFTQGGHGLSLANYETNIGGYGIVDGASVWPELFRKWVENNL